MITTALRLIDQLQLIPRRGSGVTAAELKKGLEDRGWDVHLRTVQRDMQDLSLAYPLEASGKPLRWKWSDSAKSIQAPGLDITGATIWMLVQLHLRPIMPPDLLSELSPQFSAAAAILRRTDKGRGAWPSRIASASSAYRLLPPDIDAQIYSELAACLMQGRCFNAHYLARLETAPKVLQVNPLGLILRDGVLYLLATLWDYENISHLAVHRIRRVEVLKQPSRRIQGFDLQAHANGPAFGHNLGKPLSLRLRFTEAAGFHLTESRLAEDQSIKRGLDGTLIVKATVQNTLQLRWWILGFGDQIEVLGPVTLRREIAAQAEAMLKIYQPIRARQEPRHAASGSRPAILRKVSKAAP